jgi:hypothetical protein
VKNYKIAKTSTTTKAREKMKHSFRIIDILDFYVCFTKFKNHQILLDKISHRFQLTTKLSTWRKRLCFRAEICVGEIGQAPKILPLALLHIYIMIYQLPTSLARYGSSKSFATVI